jgi:hypothetical protein
MLQLNQANTMQCTTGPAIGPRGREHVHAVHCGPGEEPKLNLLGKSLGEGFGGFGTLWWILSAAGTALGAYHGYKRNNSVGWAIGWSILGGLFPVITIPVSFAQGFAKPKK